MTQGYDNCSCGKPKRKWATRCRSCYVARPRRSIEERFWPKVKKGDGCWEWQAATYGKGYGKINVDGRLIGAHRASWILVNGPIPDGLHVCHRCDNPPCVRPDHLFLGTPSDNMFDRSAKGRNPAPSPHPSMRGEGNPAAKLTWAKVREMRDLHGRGAKIVDLARSYGVSAYVASHAINKKTWRDAV